jgi:hypothetical protein
MLRGELTEPDGEGDYQREEENCLVSDATLFAVW